MARDQTIIYNGNPIRPCIYIKVKRKSPALICFGKMCFKTGKRYHENEILHINCCKFHYYCKACLHLHIKSSLTRDPYQSIRCEVCIEVGLVNYYDSKSIITESEVQALIPITERIMIYQDEEKKRLLTKCQSGLRFCPNKGNFIEKSQILELPCGDNPCEDCYALSIIEFINEVVETIARNPSKYLNYNIVGIMCHNRHPISLRRCTCKELDEILNVNSVSAILKVETIEKYKQFFKFFMGYPVEYCRSCQYICIQEEKYNTVCGNCYRCLNCFKKEHPNLICEDYKNLENRPGKINEKKIRSSYPSDADRLIMVNISQLLKVSKVFNHRLVFYKTVSVNALAYYLNEELLKKYDSIDFLYMFSESLMNEDDINQLFYSDINQSGINHFYELNVNLNNLPDNCWILIYKVFFYADIIQRKPGNKDVDEKPKLYIRGDKGYFRKSEMAMPYVIMNLERFQ